MYNIAFQGSIEAINTWRILHLPLEISKKLPSRGLVMVSGTLNGAPFVTPLEPDGLGSHWFRIGDALAAEAGAETGGSVAIRLNLLKDWPEPEVPQDLLKALETNHLIARWHSITVRARWEWIRWIRFTHSAETRRRRIIVACSKLQDGKNRPCCFDLSRCTEPAVSKNGVLLSADPV